MRTKIYIVSFIFFLGMHLQAQEVKVEARLDTSDILIGDQIRLNIDFSMPLNYRVLWPFYSDTLTAGIEIVSQSAVDTMINDRDKLVNMLQSITITSFDSGYYYIPPLKFRYQPINDTAFGEVSSMPIYLKVHTIEVDTAQAIKAIKPPLGAPLTFAEVLPWLLIALASATLILLIIYIIRKRRRKEPIFQIRPKPVLPPFVIAINELEGLKKKKLWQAGLTKDFYTELTNILRVYIEGNFGVNAVEMTTDEILAGLRNKVDGKNAIDKLSKTLILADLVKFAKEQPLPLDNDNSMAYSIDFVHETRPHAEETGETSGITSIDNDKHKNSKEA